jgi:hypothetical protein
MESFLFAVPVATNALQPTEPLLVFVVPLRFVQFFVGQAEEVSPRFCHFCVCLVKVSDVQTMLSSFSSA